MQPTLFAIPPNPKDVAYTPDNVARDMVELFKPSGRILEPSKGEGVFLQYLPGADWCEIIEGRDFFACNTQYDWIVGNPPYSIFSHWLRHSFALAENIVYLIPIIRCFVSSRIIKDIKEFGGIRTIAVYDEANFPNWSINFAIGAVHFQRGYGGPLSVVTRARPNNHFVADRASSAQNRKAGTTPATPCGG